MTMTKYFIRLHEYVEEKRYKIMSVILETPYHHHWAAVASRGWVMASHCIQVSLSCAVLCQIVSLQYLSGTSLRRWAGLPCRIFLSYVLQVKTRYVHRFFFEAVDVFCLGPFQCSHIADYDFYPSLTQMSFYPCM